MATKAAELITVPGPDGPREVRLTSPDKVYFPEPGITKREVVEYYRALVQALHAAGVSRTIYCVNIVAEIAALLLKMVWRR